MISGMASIVGVGPVMGHSLCAKLLSTKLSADRRTDHVRRPTRAPDRVDPRARLARGESAGARRAARLGLGEVPRVVTNATGRLRALRPGHGGRTSRPRV